MASSKPVEFRWNVNSTWEHFSSLCQEADGATSAPNDFVRYHHAKASLYFGIAAIESFLNEAIRQKLAAEQKPEAEIFPQLRRTPFREKLREWPSLIGSEQIKVSKALANLIKKSAETRGEVTHPKRGDHSIYSELLDQLESDKLPSAVAEFIVRVLEASQRKFPYWILGWTFIGMNGDQRWPLLSSNQQFMLALYRLGFEISAPLADPMTQWEVKWMSSLEGYRALLEALKQLERCQPKDEGFRFMPRLCRRWWDHQHTAGCGDPT